MTDDDIKKARAIIEAANEGPWVVYHQGAMGEIRGPGWDRDECWDEEIQVVAKDVWLEDAHFIAAARDGWPAALDALELVRSMRDQEFEAARLERVQAAGAQMMLQVKLNQARDELDYVRLMNADALALTSMHNAAIRERDEAIAALAALQAKHYEVLDELALAMATIESYETP